MTITKQKQGFTLLGFSKSGFSCCSRWNICNYGKNNCVLHEKDPEAKEACNCYQRHHQSISNHQSSEIDDLFGIEDDSELEKALQVLENHIYLKKKQQESEIIKERVKKQTEKELERLSKMSDQEILEETVKRWVKMSASTNIIEGALNKGDKEKAFREFHRMINESGSGGGYISYMKIYDTIEIKVIDGRLFNPTEKELWKIYYSSWEMENEFNLFNLEDFS